MTVLLDCVLWGIELCGNPLELNRWWKQHQAALKALSPEELAVVVAAKERAKERAPTLVGPAIELVPAHVDWDETEGEDNAGN